MLRLCRILAPSCKKTRRRCGPVVLKESLRCWLFIQKYVLLLSHPIFCISSHHEKHSPAGLVNYWSSLGNCLPAEFLQSCTYLFTSSLFHLFVCSIWSPNKRDKAQECRVGKWNIDPRNNPNGRPNEKTALNNWWWFSIRNACVKHYSNWEGLGQLG